MMTKARRQCVLTEENGREGCTYDDRVKEGINEGLRRLYP